MEKEKLLQAYNLLIETQSLLIENWNKEYELLFDNDYERVLKELNHIANEILEVRNNGR